MSMNKPASPVAARLNALGANTTLTYIMEAVMSYPPLKKLDYASAVGVVQSFNDTQLLQMATLVMANAEYKNQQAIAAAAAKRGKKAQARLTAEEIKSGLIRRAQRFLAKGAEKDPARTAFRLRQFAEI